MITNFEEYLNEGWHEFMNRKLTKSSAEDVGGFFVIGALTQFSHLISMNMWWHILVYLIGASLILPTTIVWYRGLFRDLYNKIKSNRLHLIKADRKYLKAKELLEEYPDIESELKDIKITLYESVQKGDRKKTADCVNRINLLSDKLKYRESLPKTFKPDEEEKELIRQREKTLKERDPLGEEDWES